MRSQMHLRALAGALSESYAGLTYTGLPHGSPAAFPCYAATDGHRPIGRSARHRKENPTRRMRWVGVPHRRAMAVLSCSRVVSLFFSDSRQDGSLGHTGRRPRLRIYSTGSRAPLALNFCMPLRAADLPWPSARRARPAPAGTRLVATGIRVEAMALT